MESQTCVAMHKIRKTVGIARHSLAVVDDFQKHVVLRPTADDGNIGCAGIEGIFGQLANCL